MKKDGMKRFVLLVVLLVVGGLGYFTYLNTRTKEQKVVSNKTEAQQLLEYDLEENYPKTVKETVRLHCRYLKSVYNGKFDETDLKTVNLKIRKLFDDELLKYNSEDQQLQGLKTDIVLYNEKKQKFTGFVLEESSQIEYNNEDGVEYAKTTVELDFVVGKNTMLVEQEYLLRKDLDGKWKILGWQTLKKNSENAKEE